ncbi:hypothetical protein [Streptomyces sp. NPDC102437]|uniref:hypothetical protein n=1 Tax=Streptomyces sp. NPDC102437 TaxID=3366175 RepID=UPI0038243D8A
MRRPQRSVPVHYGQPRMHCEEPARRALGDSRYDAGLRAGGQLDPDAAVARALASGPAGCRETPGRLPGTLPPRENAEARRLPYIREGRA